jgi:hypothetical protein
MLTIFVVCEEERNWPPVEFTGNRALRVDRGLDLNVDPHPVRIQVVITNAI